MVESINIDRIQTTKHFDFNKLYKEPNHHEDETYFTSVELFKSFNSRNISLSMFCINCRSLEAHWDSVQTDDRHGGVGIYIKEQLTSKVKIS